MPKLPDTAAKAAKAARTTGDPSGRRVDAKPVTPLFWRADADGRWTWSGREWTTLTGLSETDSLGEGWLAAVHPDDRPAARSAWAAGQGGTRSRPSLRIRRDGGQSYDRMSVAASPARDATGAVCEWIGALTRDPGARPATFRDVAELQHHMRNALAVIRSVARRTARSSDTVDHYASHFEGRLDALARVQDAVMRSPDGGIDLQGLLDEELLASRVEEGSVRIAGPSVRLRARAAEAIGLAFHELVLNAVKFGAFASGRGALTVRWTVDATTLPRVLTVTWRETGVSIAGVAPRRQGFGTEMIERSLPYELDAATRLAFTPGELLCTIAVPLTDEIALHDIPDRPHRSLAGTPMA